MRKLYKTKTVVIGLALISVCSFSGCGKEKSDEDGVVGEYQLENFKAGGKTVKLKKKQIEETSLEIKENGKFEIDMGELFGTLNGEGTWEEEDGVLNLEGEDNFLFWALSIEGDKLVYEMETEDDTYKLIFEKQ